MKKCPKCNEIKDLSFFNKNISRKDGLQNICRKCQKERDKKSYQRPERKAAIRQSNFDRREILREWIWNYLLIYSCTDCGESDPIVLQFDHLENKKFNIADISRNVCSLKNLQKEIAKCDVVCANCHVRRTAKQFNHWRMSRPCS